MESDKPGFESKRGCVTLSKLPHLPDPQLLHLKNRENNNHLNEENSGCFLSLFLKCLYWWTLAIKHKNKILSDFLCRYSWEYRNIKTNAEKFIFSEVREIKLSYKKNSVEWHSWMCFICWSMDSTKNHSRNPKQTSERSTYLYS